MLGYATFAETKRLNGALRFANAPYLALGKEIIKLNLFHIK
jgi:hypothetical protein